MLGTVLGGIGALAVSQELGRFVFPISLLDPVTYTVTALLLTLALLAASFVPAARATRVDPMRALRPE